MREVVGERLANPIWHSLATKQAGFAVGREDARRYPASVAPFLAIEESTPEHATAMRNLAEPGEVLNLVGVFPEDLTGWAVEKRASLAQMMFQGSPDLKADAAEVTVLTVDDVPAMLELTALVYPGYFRPRTIEMGTYLGIRREGRLVAMAGERLCLDGFREVSGVCTHPNFQGRGYASRLIRRIVVGICDDGLTPFLHVNSDNIGARAAYEKLGFRRERDISLLRLKRTRP